MPADLSPHEAAGVEKLFGQLGQELDGPGEIPLTLLRELALLLRTPTSVTVRPSDRIVMGTMLWSQHDVGRRLLVPAQLDRLRVTISPIGAAGSEVTACNIFPSMDAGSQDGFAITEPITLHTRAAIFANPPAPMASETTTGLQILVEFGDLR